MDGAIEREIEGHETGKPPQAELVRDSCLTALPEGASLLIVVCLMGLPCLLLSACPVVVVLAAAGLLLAHTTLVTNQGIRFQISLVLSVCQIASALLCLIGM